MSDYTLDVLTDRFESLIVAPKAWLLYLPTSSNLTKGATLTVREVGQSGLYLGRYRTGICNKTSTEQFIVYEKGTQCYYFTPLSMPVQIYTSAIIKNNVKTSFTGSVVEHILTSSLIKAGTMSLNDVLRFYIRFFTSAVAGSSTFRVYLNTSASLVGATLIATNIVATGTLGQSPLVRNLVFKNSLSIQEIIPVASTA